MQHMLLKTPRLVAVAYTIVPSLSALSRENERVVDPIDMTIGVELLPWANVEILYSVLAVDGR